MCCREAQQPTPSGGSCCAPCRGRRTPGPRAARLHLRHGGDQRAGIGVLRVPEQLRRRTPLDDAALVEHHDLVAQMAHHREVVADEHVGDTEFLLQILHQVQHLGLHGDVECAHGLVGDDQARARDERARNGNALALAAGELVRVFSQVVGAQPDLLQHLHGACMLLGAAACAQGLQRFGDDALDALARVERSVGVLEHHLEIAARLAQFGGGQPVQIAAQQMHRSRGGSVQGHDQARQRRFARARFAHDPQTAAAVHRKAHAIERLHLARGAKEMLTRQRVRTHQVLHLEQGSVFAGAALVFQGHAASSAHASRTWAMASWRRQRTSCPASAATRVARGRSW